MKIVTWCKIWSLPVSEGEKALARSVSIHPRGVRNARHKEKNRAQKARKR